LFSNNVHVFPLYTLKYIILPDDVT